MAELTVEGAQRRQQAGWGRGGGYKRSAPRFSAKLFVWRAASVSKSQNRHVQRRNLERWALLRSGEALDVTPVVWISACGQ